MARKSKYETIVLPNIEQIESAIKEGLHDKTIYTSLGIGKTAWLEWKETKKELKSIYKNKDKWALEELNEARETKQKAIDAYNEALDNKEQWAVEKELDRYQTFTAWHKQKALSIREEELKEKRKENEILEAHIENEDLKDYIKALNEHKKV